MKKKFVFEQDLETGREQMHEWEVTGPTSARGKGKQNVSLDRGTHPIAWIAVGFMIFFAFMLILVAFN